MTDEKTKPAKKNLKKIIPLIVLVVILAVVAKLFLFKSDFLYAGTLEATKVDLSAQVASTIRAVQVQEGAPVKVAQELVTLSCDDIRIADNIATENYQRNFRLFHSGSVSQEAMDQIKNRKEDADIRLGWCSIKSPIQGTVLSRYHEPGEWVNPGTKLLTLANIKEIWAYIYIPQTEVSRLKVGMKLIGSLPEMNHREFDGHILKINDEAEFTPKNVQTQAERTRLVFGVKVSFLGSNDEEILKPGMTIEITLPKN